MTSRALSLLAAFASPVFMAAAIAGWLSGHLPATPLTLGIAALLVIGGPVLGIVHVATAEEDEPDEGPVVTLRPAAIPRAAPEPQPAPRLTPRAEAARRFAAWRDTPNAAIEQRERERRAARHLRGDRAAAGAPGPSGLA